MPATLVAISDGPNLQLDRPIMLVGRQAECDVQLHSGKISRRHCIIASINNQTVIRDLGSTNGIRINGERVVEGLLHDGDEVAIGNFRYQVRTGPVRQQDRAIEDERLERAEEPVPLDNARESQVLIAKKIHKDT
jgi:pSer/pThr/pTyr-binding forkhead associated (FHA) protein